MKVLHLGIVSMAAILLVSDTVYGLRETGKRVSTRRALAPRDVNRPAAKKSVAKKAVATKVVEPEEVVDAEPFVGPLPKGLNRKEISSNFMSFWMPIEDAVVKACIQNDSHAEDPGNLSYDEIMKFGKINAETDEQFDTSDKIMIVKRVNSRVSDNFKEISNKGSYQGVSSLFKLTAALTTLKDQQFEHAIQQLVSLLANAKTEITADLIRKTINGMKNASASDKTKMLKMVNENESHIVTNMSEMVADYKCNQLYQTTLTKLNALKAQMDGIQKEAESSDGSDMNALIAVWSQAHDLLLQAKVIIRDFQANSLSTQSENCDQQGQLKNLKSIYQTLEQFCDGLDQDGAQLTSDATSQLVTTKLQAILTQIQALYQTVSDAKKDSKSSLSPEDIKSYDDQSLKYKNDAAQLISSSDSADSSSLGSLLQEKLSTQIINFDKQIVALLHHHMRHLLTSQLFLPVM